MYSKEELRAIIKELDREREERIKVYPGLVKHGRLSQRQADNRMLQLGRAIAIISNQIDSAPDVRQLSLLPTAGGVDRQSKG